MGSRKGGSEANRRAVGYCRVSTDEQAQHGVSLDAQESRIRDYAERQGLELLAVIRDEGVSGTVPLMARPGGADVLRWMAGAGHLIACAPDRLSRDAADAIRLVRDWDRAGVRLHLTDSGGLRETKTATGRLHANLDAVLAQHTRDMIAEKTAVAMQHMSARGEHVGRAPRGWVVQRDEAGRPRLALDSTSDGAALITRARELRVEGLSFAAIARQLTSEGFRPMKATKRDSIAPATVAYMLTHSRAAVAHASA